MTTNEIRAKYLSFFQQRGHKIIPRVKIVPQNDPTTLFTGSGMQQLMPYLLGEKHPAGIKLTDSQTCFREQDIDEVGDNRHTTFFEMLGNWSLGDYFKEEQLAWFWEFLTEEIKLEPKNLYVTAFIGDPENSVPKDTESVEIWQKLFEQKKIDNKVVEIGSEDEGYENGMQDGRIFYYGVGQNWWSRAGEPANMPEGEPGGPDSEVFYDFGTEHDSKFGKHCHPNCDCGRFLEIGNSVFMQYVKTKAGFDELPKQNVDFGGGLERIAAATINSPDVFKIDLIWPVIEKLQEKSGKSYEEHTNSMRIIADHMRSAVFMAADGVTASNKTQGYILRRLLRRAIRHGLELGIESGLLESVAETILDIYKEPYPELLENKDIVISVLEREEKAFRQTLRKGLREFEKLVDKKLDGKAIFTLFDTYGFPPELSLEEAKKQNIEIDKNWQKDYEAELSEQKDRSRTAAAGMFKGGLAEHSEQTIKYHTATHVMYRALRTVLGDHVEQRGSNITNERLRFDFNHPAKVTPEEQKQVEDIVNKAIKDDLPVTWKEMPTKEGLATGARGHFGEKYGDVVKVYTIGDPKKPYTMELCGGPHVEHTGTLADGSTGSPHRGGMDSTRSTKTQGRPEQGRRTTGAPSKKHFKILKEESSAAGIRRIKAVLQ